MERSLRFYRDLLQLRIVRTMNESGDYIDNMLSLENVQVTTVKMSADGGSTLVELLEFKSRQHRNDTDHEIYSIGPSHFAFTVDDLDEVYHRLRQSGVPFNAPPQISPDGRVKVTFCQDPDGTHIELVQVLESED
ncbi:VOC family protein [Acidobacteria bacterium AH-259-A15]|nr:VOC family protein [Acidobacteria bacterium AH-259-A15]